jgi:CRP/FNR family cyclic AMP-dependent transcriptional regulator
VLCMEGDPTTHLFILLSGWVKVTNVTRDGREILVALYGGGSVFGEIAGRVTGYRTATVRAIGPVRVLVIGAERFEDFLDAHPAVARAYRQAIAQGQQAAYEYQRNQSQSSGAQRLACLLLDLAGQEGTPAPDRGEIASQLSQEELASLISASRSTVTRALREWRSRRIISTDQRRIEILDRMRLARIAGRLR